MKATRGYPRVAPLLAVAALVIVMLATAACGTPTSATTTKTYTSKDYGYTFLYPKDWRVADQTSVGDTAGGTSVSEIGVLDPAGATAGSELIDTAIVSIYKLNATIVASMMPDVRKEVETVLASIESQQSDIKTLNALSEITINGMSGFKVTYSLTKSGTPITSTMYFLFSGNIEYQVTVQAADPNWGKDKPIFDAMMASFQPGPSK